MRVKSSDRVFRVWQPYGCVSYVDFDLISFLVLNHLFDFFLILFLPFPIDIDPT